MVRIMRKRERKRARRKRVRNLVEKGKTSLVRKTSLLLLNQRLRKWIAARRKVARKLRLRRT